MKRIDFNTIAALTVLLVIAAASGCAESEGVLNAAYDMPTGLAIAGTDVERLFIANTGEDALQVIALGENLDTLNPVEGPSYYFPLRIPGGPAPEEIAASENGRFVVVLNWVTEKLHIIDADLLDTARRGGVDVEIALGAEGQEPYRLIAVPSGCARSGFEDCAGVFLVSLPGSGSVSELVLREDSEGPLGEVSATHAVDGMPGELTVSADGLFAYAADTSTAHVHRIDLENGNIDKFDVGYRASSLGVSSDGRFLVVGRPAVEDVLIFDGAGLETMTQVLANPSLVPASRCLVDCTSPVAPEEQCPGAHPADLGVCSGPGGVEQGVNGDYAGMYVGFIPASLTPLGVGAGNPIISVPCQSIAVDPLLQNWSEVMLVLGQNGEGYLLGLTMESDEATSPVILSQGWCNGAGLTDIAVSSYEAAQEAVTDGASEELTPPLAFDSIFGPCLAFPEGLNRYTCVGLGDSDAGILLNPMRNNILAMDYQWEPIVQLGDNLGIRFEREISGGIYRYENETAYFADSGISIGSFAPYINTRKKLVEMGKCSEDTVHCGDILEITSPLAAAIVIAGTDPTIDQPSESCLEALAGEPSLGCSLERRIIDTVNVNGSTELVLDRPLPEACMPGSGRIAYRVRMADVFGLRVGTTKQTRMAPGESMGIGGDVLPTNALTASIRTDTVADESLGACERYGPGGAYVGTRYDRDSLGSIRVYDAHSKTVNEGTASEAVVGLTWSMLLTTAGDPLSPKGIPMLLGQTITWSREDAPLVLFTSYARSNRVVGMVPYAHVGDPDDALDNDVAFLSPAWRDLSTHFNELD